ncbi:hypothetical protein SCP_0701660 [Sparassis crispa]|uniref:Uncharacterized protein n=1 Tax=Sparassis crispa TaxID=139825 RepID=A0A401GRX2_9APHY|nr:hypothetical protein SCP_0701660 [Sparassis crispa]GBE84982.1 hypothetical protein SCP_0701660 [Sparassis crispa]
MQLSLFDPKGHLVSATMLFNIYEKVAVPHSSKLVLQMKKDKSTKCCNIKLDDLTLHSTFIAAFLTIHDITNQYVVNVQQRPAFKIGSKATAPTIETDDEFKMTLTALLKHKNCSVSVKFNVTMMDQFRHHKHVIDLDSEAADNELMHGMKVPCLDQFSDEMQLHGDIILELKQKWARQEHRGEHGNPGHCYVDPTSQHLRLNNLKLKTWARAIAVHSCGNSDLPNELGFNIQYDSHLTAAKARDHMGPQPLSAGPLLPTASQDLSAMLMMAVMPLLVSLIECQAPAASSASSVPCYSHPSILSNTPLPNFSKELRCCLRDFQTVTGINILHLEESLKVKAITPVMIRDMPVPHLCELSGALKGHMWQFQRFLQEVV